MASARDIRRRIKSVKNTSQITRAMQMVAAAKMRRAQDLALAGRPYTELMNQMLGNLAQSAEESRPRLMREPETSNGKRAVILISSDKGLCGGLNTNLLREASKLSTETTEFVCVGRKGSQFVARTQRSLLAEFTYKDNPEFSEARAISKFAQSLFLEKSYSAVDVLYTNFISTINQRPELNQLLPVNKVESLSASLVDEDRAPEEGSSENAIEFEFEPTSGSVLSDLLPHYVTYRVYQFLMECKASEHSARMVAMKNATDNAKQLIKDLTLEYNKLRQASITNELLEITTASMAVGA